MEKGTVKKRLDGLKILADGVLDRILTVKADRFSSGAKEKITAVGGTVQEI
jgi:large subunit ribosomal protein L15